MRRQFCAKLMSCDGLLLLILTGVMALTPIARAQLVADGQTNVLNGVTTNLTGGLIVGTNGDFTLLILTNGATVTNTSGNSEICAGSGSKSNTLVVTGAGTIFQTSASIFTGVSGSEAQLDVLNGGTLISSGGAIGQQFTGSNNLVVISGPGSLWTNNSGLGIGNNSSGNSLVISNGGQVINGTTSIGELGSDSNNSVIVTGAGSSWTSGYLLVGNMTTGGGNLLLVTNGGGVTVTGNTLDIGPYSSSNTVFITDPGSSLTCPTYRIGYSSAANTCIVSNGATLSVMLNSPATIEGTRTTVVVTGTNSLWTNNSDFYLEWSSNSLSILNGGTLVNNNGYITAAGTNSTNIATVAGAKSLWKNYGNLSLDGPGAQLYITNGATVNDIGAYIGDTNVSSNAFALVSGAGSVWTNGIIDIGENGSGNEVVVANSAALYGLYVTVGGNANNNLLVVSNSGTVNAGTLEVGNPGIGNDTNIVLINGGNVNVSSVLMLNSYATVTQNSGQTILKSLTTSGSNCRIALNGGTMQCGNASYTASGTNMPVFNVGDGTNAASLVLSNNTHTFSGGLAVNSNSTLTAMGGTLNAKITVNSGGTFIPGSSSSLPLTVFNNLVLNNGSTMVALLNSTSGTNITVRGLSNVVYGGTLQITNMGSFYSFGQAFKLFAANSYSGMFTNIVPATPGFNMRWDLDELVVDGVLRVEHASRPAPNMQFTTAGNSLNITSTNGLAYDFIYLYTSTNLLAPSGGWTAVSTNAYDVNGNVNFTNVFSAGDTQRFFKIGVN